MLSHSWFVSVDEDDDDDAAASQRNCRHFFLLPLSLSLTPEDWVLCGEQYFFIESRALPTHFFFSLVFSCRTRRFAATFSAQNVFFTFFFCSAFQLHSDDCSSSDD